MDLDANPKVENTTPTRRTPLLLADEMDDSSQDRSRTPPLSDMNIRELCKGSFPIYPERPWGGTQNYVAPGPPPNGVYHQLNPAALGRVRPEPVYYPHYTNPLSPGQRHSVPIKRVKLSHRPFTGALQVPWGGSTSQQACLPRHGDDSAGRIGQPGTSCTHPSSAGTSPTPTSSHASRDVSPRSSLGSNHDTQVQPPAQDEPEEDGAAAAQEDSHAGCSSGAENTPQDDETDLTTDLGGTPRRNRFEREY
ncbi:hypothetical protein MKZ38_006624 [Zalerion maritima]|uniref:Uncharacterized protein n=1 Tax=Zalerion maritima TaxID=339359 RepID=A0AAD5RNN4_9PEZI|nr:hypothetical protein MKZ38_006624 [Zalerion maritima]